MRSIGCGYCQFTGLKTLGSLQYRGGAAEFFLTIEFNYVIIRIKLFRCVE